jgi:glycosyltransferase involved in cell wall biosynthesis
MNFISILIPCYNEISTIEKSIKQAIKLKKLKKEIIIIDNGSIENN